jgi:hypothetical protein
MDKDFPSYLFPNVEKPDEDEILDKETSLDYYKVTENLIKLNYNCPVNIEYDDKEKQLKCLTQKFYSSECLSQQTPLFPWHLPANVNKNLSKLFISF